MPGTSKWLSWAVVVIIVIVGGWWVLGSRTATAPETGPISIGFVGPLSGGQAVWGEGARNMMQLAIDEINTAGGIDGRQINATYQDGKGNPKDALSAVQTLTQSGVKIVLGGHSSPETSGMVPASKDGSFFMIAGVTSSDNAVADSSYAFRTSPPAVDFATQLVAVAKPKFTKIAVLTETAAFSKSYSDDFIKLFTAAGGTVLAQETYQPEVTDFRSTLLKIKAAKPDALFISPQNPTAASNIAKQMKELGLTMPVFGNSILVTKAVYANSDNSSALVNAFSIVPYVDQSSDKAQALIEKYKARFGSAIPYSFFYVSATYDAVYMVKEAIQSCGNTDPKCVADYFRKIQYNGVTADYSFKQNGDSSFNTYALITLDKSGKEVVTPIK